MDPHAVSAGLFDRRDAGKTLQLVGRPEAIALRPQGGHQPWRHDFAGARQRIENRPVGLRGGEFPNRLLIPESLPVALSVRQPGADHR